MALAGKLECMILAFAQTRLAGLVPQDPTRANQNQDNRHYVHLAPHHVLLLYYSLHPGIRAEHTLPTDIAL